MSQDLHAELDRIYEGCIKQVRTIAALDPTEPVVGWSEYTCTSAYEFAADAEREWLKAHPEHEERDMYGAIMDGVPIERESLTSGESPTRYITYGLTSFAHVLHCIEAMRAGRFAPPVPGGITRNNER